MKQAFSVVAGLFFAILALVQFTRIYLDFPLIINGAPMPIWVSVVACIATGIISAWMFIRAKNS
ncbi:MAG: hypothetical protein LLF94_01920 [Chlamydiales bacterium]|nr:hypothetical protein [Chlamydiales bacterium]